MEENGEKDVPSQNWMAAQGGRPRDPFFTTISRPGSILVQHDRSLVRFPCGGATRTGWIRDEEITREGGSIDRGRSRGRQSFTREGKVTTREIFLREARRWMARPMRVRIFTRGGAIDGKLDKNGKPNREPLEIEFSLFCQILEDGNPNRELLEML
jgi:hypothetical protein